MMNRRLLEKWRVATVPFHPHYRIETADGEAIASIEDHHDGTDETLALTLAQVPAMLSVLESILSKGHCVECENNIRAIFFRIGRRPSRHQE